MAKAEVRQPGNGLYELGATVNGVFVPFVTLPETQVDGIVQAGKSQDAPTPAADDAGDNT